MFIRVSDLRKLILEFVDGSRDDDEEESYDEFEKMAHEINDVVLSVKNCRLISSKSQVKDKPDRVTGASQTLLYKFKHDFSQSPRFNADEYRRSTLEIINRLTSILGPGREDSPGTYGTWTLGNVKCTVWYGSTGSVNELEVHFYLF